MNVSGQMPAAKGSGDGRVDSGIAGLFHALRERLPSVIREKREEKDKVQAVGRTQLVRHTTSLLTMIIREDPTVTARVLDQIKRWIKINGNFFFDLSTQPETLLNSLVWAMFGQTEAFTGYSQKELLYVLFYIVTLVIRRAGEAAQAPTRDSDEEVDILQPQEGLWHEVANWTLCVLRFAWADSNKLIAARRVVRSAGEALGGISLVDLNCFIDSISRAFRPYSSALNSRSKNNAAAKGAESVFHALSFVCVPSDPTAGEGKRSGLPYLLELISPYTNLKAPKSPDQVAVVLAVLEGMEYFLVQPNFAGVEENVSNGRFDASKAALRRLFASRVEPLYGWASGISKVSDKGIKSAALRTMCSILLCSPHEFFRDNFPSFLSKRCLAHINEPKKVHTSLKLLLKALRGPALSRRGARAGGGQVPFTGPWHPSGMIWDLHEPMGNKDENRGQWWRVMRRGEQGASLVTKLLDNICQSLFKRKVLARIPNDSLPLTVGIGAQVAVHSLQIAFTDVIRPLLPPRNKADEIRAAGVGIRIALQILDPEFQDEASLTARLARDVENEDQWRRMLQNYVNQMATDLSSTVSTCLSMCMENGNQSMSTTASTIGQLPRRWRRAGLADWKQSSNDLASARREIRLMPTNSMAPSTPDQFAKTNHLFSNADIVISEALGKDFTSTEIPDTKIPNLSGKDAVRIAEDTLGAAMSLLVFVRPAHVFKELGSMLSPHAPAAVQWAATRYLRRVVVYQPETFTTIAFLMVRSITGLPDKNSQQSAALLNHLANATAEWGGACVEAAGAEGGEQKPEAPGWAREARSTALPLLHACSLCMLAHPSSSTRRAALALSREVGEADAGLLGSWSGWDRQTVVSDHQDTKVKAGDPATLNGPAMIEDERPTAFHLVPEGEAGESALVVAAMYRYMKHSSRFYLPSDSSAPEHQTSSRAPWMANITCIAEGLSTNFFRLHPYLPNPEMKKRNSAEVNLGVVASLALNIGMAMNHKMLSFKPDLKVETELLWHFETIPLLLSLSPKDANESAINVSVPKNLTESGSRIQAQLRDRKQWKKIQSDERKEAIARIERQNKAVVAMWNSLNQIEQKSFSQFCNLGVQFANKSDSNLNSKLDYAAAIACMARIAEKEPAGMKQLLFAIENAHVAHVPAILESLLLFSVLPSIQSRGGPPNPEIRLRSMEPIRKRTDALRHLLFYALSGNSGLSRAMAENKSVREAVISEAMRVNTERIVAWGLGPIALRNVARSIRNVAACMVSAGKKSRTMSLKSQLKSTDLPGTEVRGAAFKPSTVKAKVRELMAWAAAVDDILARVDFASIGSSGRRGIKYGRNQRKIPTNNRGIVSTSRVKISRNRSPSESRKLSRKPSALDIEAHHDTGVDTVGASSRAKPRSDPSSPVSGLKKNRVKMLPGMHGNVDTSAKGRGKKEVVLPHQYNPTPQQTRACIRALLHNSRPGLDTKSGANVDTAPTSSILSWASDLVEMRNACFEAVGSLLWINGLKERTLPDEDPKTPTSKTDNDTDAVVNELVDSLLATDLANSSAPQPKAESLKRRGSNSNFMSGFGSRSRIVVAEVPRVIFHPLQGYGGLAALASQHWDNTFKLLLEEIYSPFPRGGSDGRACAFAAIANRFKPTPQRMMIEDNFSSKRNSISTINAIGKTRGPAHTGSGSQYNLSAFFSTKLNVRRLSDADALDLAVLGLLYAGHPELDVSTMGIHIVCALGPALGGGRDHWPRAESESLAFGGYAADPMLPGPAERRRSIIKLASQVRGAIQKTHTDALRNALIRRALQMRQALDDGARKVSEGDGFARKPTFDIPTRRSDPEVAPCPHLIFPLRAAQKSDWVVTPDALAWLIRGGTPWLLIPRISISELSPVEDVEKVCQAYAKAPPDIDLATLVATTAVLANGVQGNDQVVEDALASLWVSVLFAATEEKKLRAPDPDLGSRSSMMIESDPQKHIVSAMLLCIRLLSGAPGIAYAGVFQADYVRVANLSTHLQIHASPALSACRIVAAAAISGGDRFMSVTSHSLRWALCNSSWLAEVWWKGSSSDSKVVGERCAWGAAAGLLSRLRLPDDILSRNEMENKRVQSYQGRLIFHCFHHLTGPPCLAPALLMHLWSTSLPSRGISSRAASSRINHRSVKSYYGNSGLTGVPRGLCLRRFYWKALEEADENALNTQLADMRDPEGVWRSELKKPPPPPRQGMAARAGRPLEADASWREGFNALLGVEVSKDVDTASARSLEQHAAGYREVKEQGSQMLLSNAELAGGKSKDVSAFLGTSSATLGDGDSGIMSADSVLCGFAHELLRCKKSHCLRSWAEEALKNAELVKEEWNVSRGADAARQLRDLLAVLPPEHAVAIDVSTRIAALLAAIIPAPLSKSTTNEQNQGDQKETRTVLQIERLPQERVNFCQALAQALVARLWRGASAAGGFSDDLQEIKERQGAFWGLVSIMETNIEHIYRTAVSGVLLGLRPASTCFPSSQMVTADSKLKMSPSPCHVVWMQRILARGLLKPRLAPMALLAIPLAVVSDLAQSEKEDALALKERILTLLALGLPWAFCLFDARRKMDERKTRSAELLPPGCFDIDIAPETLCNSMADSIESLNLKDDHTAELCNSLRYESDNATAPITRALLQALRIIRQSSEPPRLAHCLGSVLHEMYTGSPFALKEGVLRVVTIVLREAPSFLGIQSAGLGALMTALYPLAEGAAKGGGKPAREAAAAYAWTARATPQRVETEQEQLLIGGAPSTHGVAKGFVAARECLMEVAVKGWVTSETTAKQVQNWIKTKAIRELRLVTIAGGIQGRPTAFSMALSADTKHRPATKSKVRGSIFEAAANVSGSPSKVSGRIPATQSPGGSPREVQAVVSSDGLDNKSNDKIDKENPTVSPATPAVPSTTPAVPSGTGDVSKQEGDQDQNKPAEEKSERREGKRPEDHATAQNTPEKAPLQEGYKVKVPIAPKSEAECWEEVRSATGDIYYWNTVTDKVQWTRPDCLDASELDKDKIEPATSSRGHRRQGSTVHRRERSKVQDLQSRLMMQLQSSTPRGSPRTAKKDSHFTAYETQK
mmetsp:Transcript_21362/g.52306  ORF Transcript_21362/g.52306 Transcript_21362/m.52306 type:complete len:3061 (+) Transcript_21362:111-9293(+)